VFISGITSLCCLTICSADYVYMSQTAGRQQEVGFADRSFDDALPTDTAVIFIVLSTSVSLMEIFYSHGVCILWIPAALIQNIFLSGEYRCRRTHRNVFRPLSNIT
jgi:cytochrome c biogenesis protein CcdA